MYTIAAGILIAFAAMWLGSIVLIGFFSWLFRERRPSVPKTASAPDEITLAAKARWEAKTSSFSVGRTRAT